MAGATISLAVSPGWFSELTTGGQGWIAVGLVIFAQWNPWRAMAGAYMFGALRRLILDLQGPTMLFGFANPFFYMPKLGFFLQMLPYALVIIILVIGSREAMKKRSARRPRWACRMCAASAADNTGASSPGQERLEQPPQGALFRSPFEGEDGTTKYDLQRACRDHAQNNSLAKANLSAAPVIQPRRAAAGAELPQQRLARAAGHRAAVPGR